MKQPPERFGIIGVSGAGVCGGKDEVNHDGRVKETAGERQKNLRDQRAREATLSEKLT
jgi:hypothetical protein